LLALVLGASLILATTACSVSGSSEEVKVADFGTFGSELALQLAKSHPFRSPGSSQELAARDFLLEAFEDLGYKVTLQEFTFTNTEGQVVPSFNLIVRIKGAGIKVTDDAGETGTVRRQVIIGAHYDVPVTREMAEADLAAREQEAAGSGPQATGETGQAGESETTAGLDQTKDLPTLADYDGIHANASGVGTLLTVARQLKREDLDYDVLLVAFGAGTAGQAGAKAFLHAAMSADDIAITEAMYNIDGIYAGDDIYAHAGQNSVLPGNRKLYEKRRKLYEATDVFFEHTLYSKNGYNLNTNQASFYVPLPDSSETGIYREWTLHRSDHTPFDQAGIPIVFFESYDYDHDTLEEMKETKNPTLSSTGGTIRGTAFDSVDFLQYLFDSDIRTRLSDGDDDDQQTVSRLEQRINNTAFIIVEAVKRRPVVIDTKEERQ
jgi:alkaline phosphatase isozyme conversion protein